MCPERVEVIGRKPIISAEWNLAKAANRNYVIFDVAKEGRLS